MAGEGMDTERSTVGRWEATVRQALGAELRREELPRSELHRMDRMAGGSRRAYGYVQQGSSWRPGRSETTSDRSPDRWHGVLGSCGQNRW